jgi:hypothetical protein
MRFKLKSGNYIGLPIMFLSLGGYGPHVVQRQLLTLNGRRNTNGSGAIGCGGTIGGGGAKKTTSMQGPLPIFNLVVEFFCQLQQNYQGVRIEKL